MSGGTARATTDPLKTQTVYLILRDQILSGEWAPGDRLPGEPTLAAGQGVSRVTVRRALAQLAEEGLIERRAGAGTFVRVDRAKVGTLITDVANAFGHLLEMGRSTDVRLIAFSYVRAPEPVRVALGLGEGAVVQRSVRVRLIDGTPFSYLTAHVPEEIGRVYSETDLAHLPLLELMERTGLRTHHARQEMTAVLAGPEVAEALGVAVGSPLVSLSRVVFGPADEGMEHLHALYRPDLYSLRMDLVRTGREGARHWSASAGADARKR
ncbi:GntR family transcriptional regulator [Acuticoccus kandeliae]|uniref:GntR family transcriptional regulator n=1 Tax=Acuticoccus kandeliae TaxID=2073160 RepID=UPI000D3E4959|nr:GntR family transcriptional regulator [Acuticoccus kandeliae]